MFEVGKHKLNGWILVQEPENTTSSSHLGNCSFNKAPWKFFWNFILNCSVLIEGVTRNFMALARQKPYLLSGIYSNVCSFLASSSCVLNPAVHLILGSYSRWIVCHKLTTQSGLTLIQTHVMSHQRYRVNKGKWERSISFLIFLLQLFNFD